jgi:hypothetical protein
LAGKLSPDDGVTVRIGEDARKCVVFFGVRTLKGDISYGGTGFLVSWTEQGHGTPYLVTNRHVARNLDLDFIIRVNRLSGGSEEIPVERVEWTYHQDRSVDLAATKFLLRKDRYAVGYYPVQEAATKNDAVCGDPVSLVGLFRLHRGSSRNVPIVHSGHIAAIADRTELVPLKDPKTGEILETEAYLVEAQTLEGLSGSPVFIRQFVQLSFVTTDSGAVPLAYGASRLLGLYQGAWDGAPGEILANDRNVRGDLRVPVGMGTVIPSEKILELNMNDPKLKQDRANSRARDLGFRAAKQDSGSDDVQLS